MLYGLLDIRVDIKARKLYSWTRILITGAAGFIGFHLAQSLLLLGFNIVGVDNLSDYYDVRLKKSRLLLLQSHPNFCFEYLNIADESGMLRLFEKSAT